jgi:ribose-phosphate pyrophosphokinase
MTIEREGAPVVLLGPDEHFRARQIPPGYEVLHARREIFPDGEQLVRIPRAELLGGRRVLVVQRAAHRQDSALMTMLQLVDAAREAGAGDIACLAPYLCYQRQDRACHDGEPVTARLVLRMLAAAGARTVLCVDRHGRTPTGPGLPRLTDLTCASALAMRLTGPSKSAPAPDLVLAPDVGAYRRAATAAEAMAVPVLHLDKTKDAERGTGFSPIPSGLAGHRVLVVEDLCSTGSTLVPLHERLLECGVRPQYFVTHLLADPEFITKKLAGAEGVHYSDSCGHEDAAVHVLPLALEAWAADGGS